MNKGGKNNTCGLDLKLIKERQSASPNGRVSKELKFRLLWPRRFRWLIWIGWTIVTMWSSEPAAASVVFRNGSHQHGHHGSDEPEQRSPLGAEIVPDAVELELTIWRAGERPPRASRIKLENSLVRGRAVYRWSTSRLRSGPIVLLNFAEAWATAPRDIDEVEVASYVHGSSDHGKLKVSAITAEGQSLSWSFADERHYLIVDVPIGIREIEIQYEVKVPHRYWPFGCVRRRCSLNGALAPLPSRPANGGRWSNKSGRVVQPTRWSISKLEFAKGPKNLLEKRNSSRRRDGKSSEEILVLGADLNAGKLAYPNVVWGPKWRRFTTTYHGIDIELLHMNRRPGDRVPHERKLQWRRDIPGNIMQVAKEVVHVASGRGLRFPPDRRLTIIQGPLRSDLSQSHPGLVMVSDAYGEIIPIPRFRKFHEVQLARSIFDTWTHAWIHDRQNASTALWLSGAMAMMLTRNWERRRILRDEDAGDILNSWTFVPSVDRFLYAGQESFVSAYFRGVEDYAAIRNHPMWFGHDLPTGRRIHEKLRDLMGQPELERFYDDMIAKPAANPQQVAENRYEHQLSWFFDQWLGPYPELDYAIDEVKSYRRPDGKWVHKISVLRDGDQGVVEPVQLYVKERGGTPHYLIWNGESGEGRDLERQFPRVRHTWKLVTDRKLATVWIDPRSRLVETSRISSIWPDRPGNTDPLYNNRVPKQTRFLYTGLGLDIAASELIYASSVAAKLNAITGYAFFEVSRRRDLGKTGSILLFKGRETFGGLGGALFLHFSDKVTRQRRRMRLRFGVSIDMASNLSLDPVGGLRVGQSLSFADDTRKFWLRPERGHRIWGQLNATQILRIDSRYDDHRYSLSSAAGWIQLWPLTHGHLLATSLELGLTMPIQSRPEFRTLQRAGGIGGLSGFAADELFGLGMMAGHLEYRHSFIDGLRINLVNLAWIRDIRGAVFAGVGSLSNCENYGGWFKAKSWRGQVGYGLSSLVQMLGLSYQLVRLDVAIPIGRRTRTCLGQVLPDYLATRQGLSAKESSRLLRDFNINLTFNQPF